METIRKRLDDIAFVALLKACAAQKDIHKGTRLHSDILKRGLLQRNIFIGNTLVHMYAKCGALAMAQQVFNQLSFRNVVSWNAIVAGYSQHGHGEEALKCLELMQREGVSPDAITFTCVLSACGNIGAAKKGKELHAEIVRNGLLGNDTVLGNALVNMYAKCGALSKAQQVFDKLPIRNTVSWTALITGYCQHGHGEDALICFELMKHEGLLPDVVTFACILKACGGIGAAEKGEVIHGLILKEGFLGKSSVIGSALVDMYAKCGVLPKAQFLFDELCVQDIVTWNALITGYCQHGHCQDALKCFEQMKHEAVSPDAVTFACILKACGCVGAADKGKEIHAEVVRKDLLGNDFVLGNALVDMYAKCGALATAQEVFDKLPVRDVATWTALFAGYCEQGHGEDALNCFEQMKQEGLFPDAVTFTCILKAYGNIGVAEKGKELHAEIIREGLLGNVCVLETALMDMYVNCGALAKAQSVFDELPIHDVVSWNVLISGYCQHGCGGETLNSFERMKREGIPPDAVTLACVLKACGGIGATQKGKEIHSEIVREGFLRKFSVLGSALVDMYAKCGALGMACEVFDELPVQDVVSWTALITAYCEQGHGEEAFVCFEKMTHAGLSPDAVTFACILKACGRIGAAERGQMYFETMSTHHGIIPTLEHHSCMVNLFGCTGYYDKAMAVMEKMPSSHYLPSWVALLGACQKSGSVKLGRLAFEHV